MTWNEALKICKELWTWCVETGLEKEDWEGWKKYGEMKNDCPFCELARQLFRVNGEDYASMCWYCPLYIELNMGCDSLGYSEWSDAETKRTRKKYAKIFLEKLNQIPEKQDDKTT